jgi:hypothetical protein
MRVLTLIDQSEKYIKRLGWEASQAGRERVPKKDVEMTAFYVKCKAIGDSAYVSALWIKGYKLHEECKNIGVI